MPDRSVNHKAIIRYRHRISLRPDPMHSGSMCIMYIHILINNSLRMFGFSRHPFFYFRRMPYLYGTGKQKRMQIKNERQNEYRLKTNGKTNTDQKRTVKRIQIKNERQNEYRSKTNEQLCEMTIKTKSTIKE